MIADAAVRRLLHAVPLPPPPLLPASWRLLCTAAPLPLADRCLHDSSIWRQPCSRGAAAACCIAAVGRHTAEDCSRDEFIRDSVPGDDGWQQRLLGMHPLPAALVHACNRGGAFCCEQPAGSCSRQHALQRLDSRPCSCCRLPSISQSCASLQVPLCGHATLASAAALFFGERNPARQLAFETLSGELVVTRQAAGAAGKGDAQAAAGSSSSAGSELLSMDLPLIEATAEAVPPGMDAVVQVRGAVW